MFILNKKSHYQLKLKHPFLIILATMTFIFNGLSLIFLLTHLSTEFLRTPTSIDKRTIIEKDKSLIFKNWGLSHQLKNSHISAPDAWTITHGSRKILVAVVDTGIDPNHKDLKDNLWFEDKSPSSQSNVKVTQNNSFQKMQKRSITAARRNQKTSENKTNVSQLNKKSSIFGWDFVTNKPNPIDEHGHGTHVSGIIGAITNTQAGISGVSPLVSLLSARYYSDSNTGKANLDNTVKSLYYAIEKGARIINYSGGGPQFSQEEFNAMKAAEEKGILVVAAAGNERQNIDLESNYYFPSAYSAYGLKNIISVAAIDIENKLLKSSNWGLKKVDVAAPGENIYSTLPGNRYGYLSGTSQATAFVTGLAALMLAENPNLTPVEIKNLIIASVDKTKELDGKVVSGGKINAYKTLLALRKQNIIPIKDAPSEKSKITYLPYFYKQ